MKKSPSRPISSDTDKFNSRLLYKKRKPLPKPKLKTIIIFIASILVIIVLVWLWNLELRHRAEINASKAKAKSFTQPWQWTNLAQKQISNKNYVIAIQSYRKALQMDPSFYIAWNGLGKLYEDLKHFNRAIALYNEAIETFPGNTQEWQYKIRYTSALKTFEEGQILETIDQLEQLLKEFPQLDRAWLKLADVYNHEKKVVYRGKPWDFYFKQTGLKKAMIFIARVAELNMVIHQDINGSITCQLNQVRWDKALDLFLKINGVTKCVIGNIYLLGSPVILERCIQYGTSIDSKGINFKLNQGKLVDLSFFNEDIHYVLRSLADKAGIQIVIDPDLDDSITCEMNRIPWDSALDVLLPMNGLTGFRLGNLVRVGKKTDMDLMMKDEAGVITLLQSLLQLDPTQVGVKDNSGKTLLFWASEKGYAKLASYLISLGARVNERDRWNFTPLHEAANKETANALITKGALVNVQSNSGLTPLQTAVYGLRIETAMLLIEKGAVSNFFLDAAIGRMEHLHKQVLKNPAVVNSIGAGGWTPLHHAVVTGQYSTVEFLIAKNADINAVTLKGDTPLHLAVSRGHTHLVKLLVLNKAKLNEKNKFGFTPLHIARTDGKSDIIKLLQKYGGIE